MREKSKYIVITFYTTAEAMHMEKYCHGNCIQGRLIPVPREISAGCGLAWRMSLEEYAAFDELLIRADIEFEEIKELYL